MVPGGDDVCVELFELVLDLIDDDVIGLDVEDDNHVELLDGAPKLSDVVVVDLVD